jgi:hypothetical protein
MKNLEIFFRAGALDDLQNRDGADTERDIPVEDLAKIRSPKTASRVGNAWKEGISH